MYINSSELLSTKIEELSNKVVQWTTVHYPEHSRDYQKRFDNISLVLNGLVYCLRDGNTAPMNQTSGLFFNTKGNLQIKPLHIEFEAYNFLLKELNTIFDTTEPGSVDMCTESIQLLKKNLSKGVAIDNDDISVNMPYEDRIKRTLYGWDDEKRIMHKMQQCQRNWNVHHLIPKDAVNYLLWIAENAPSKQHEAYYDVYYSTDRATIEYLYQFSWGSTHRKNPPAMWRNSQMNANLYMIFVVKQPPTMFNCNNDGTLQSPWGQSRWDNAIVSVGMAMGLVMRAANKMGLSTGPNKVIDLGPDYDYEWEKKLGIYEDVMAGTKKIFFGLGIGMANPGRPRWESDDTEFAIGASNGHNVTVKYDDPDFEPLSKNGQQKRKIKIVDIKEYGDQTLVDPYGNWQVIPTEHAIKINTVYQRDIKTIEIPK